MWNSHLVKTVLRRTVSWHSVHSRCYATALLLSSRIFLSPQKETLSPSAVPHPHDCHPSACCPWIWTSHVNETHVAFCFWLNGFASRLFKVLHASLSVSAHYRVLHSVVSKHRIWEWMSRGTAHCCQPPPWTSDILSHLHEAWAAGPTPPGHLSAWPEPQDRATLELAWPSHPPSAGLASRACCGLLLCLPSGHAPCCPAPLSFPAHPMPFFSWVQ